MPEVGIGDGTVRMLCRIELHRPEVDDGIRTRNRPIKGSIRCLRTGHPSTAGPPEIKWAAAWDSFERRSSRSPRTGRCMKLWVSRVQVGGTDKVL
ncbi:hypothetical protein GCM10010330_70770 [Streptomyces tendae]|nr:hypothetical protein GCM10010330_70770 [Streptomyces tendae]